MSLKKNLGFTLLEMIIVLAIIGLVATVVLPSLRRTANAEFMDAIRNLSTQVKLAYDDTIFTGRVHRMVFDVKNGTFSTQIAPDNFSGRAPINTEEFQARKTEKTKYFKQFSDEADSAKSLDTLILEIPIVKRDVLQDTEGNWTPPTNRLIASQQFPGNIIFNKIYTGLAKQPIAYPASFVPKKSNTTAVPDDINLAYVYFFPEGSTTAASFQIGMRTEDGNLDINALKYTLNLNIFTGQLKLIQGFEEADFVLPQES